MFISFLVKSIVELTKELLAIDGVDCILTEKFSQDPLEEYFSKHRRRQGCASQINYETFGHSTLALNVMDSSLITDLTGNTRGRGVEKPEIDIHDLRSLPKKKKIE